MPGGQVWAVEVSTDGGSTWQPAVGRGNWSYGWTPATSGSVTIKSRAVDDSGNLETPSPGVTVTVTGGQTTIWPSNAVPGVVDQGADSPVELGVKFYSEVGGAIKGIRFYKSSRQYRVPCSKSVVEHRDALGLYDIYQRNVVRLAAGELCDARCRSIRLRCTWLLTTPTTAITAPMKITSLRIGERQFPAIRPGQWWIVGIEWRLCLWLEQRLP